MLADIDFTNMTKQQEIELLQLLEEESKNMLSTYNNPDIIGESKVHHKQVVFHKDPHRNRWLFGGNRSGKTVAGAVEAVWWARGNHPYKKINKPTRGWIVSVSNEVQRDVAQREVLRWLNPDWIVGVQARSGSKDSPETAVLDYILVKSMWGGVSVIGFKSCEQGRTKFQGTSLDWIWFDEQPAPDGKAIYDECCMRLIDTDGYMWGTMTPLNGLDWIYDTIFINKIEDPDVIFWHMNWWDNPWLNEETIKRIEAKMTEEERDARQYGKFIAASGLVYKDFDVDIHIIDPFDVDPNWYDEISIDAGFRNPLSCHWYACDPEGNVYVIREHYEKEKVVEYHAKEILRISDELGWKRNSAGKLKALIDSAALKRSEMTAKSTVNLFHEYGIICNAKVDKSVWAGIQRVKNYLKLRPCGEDERVKFPKGKPSLFVFSTCTNMIQEFKTYRWDDTESELSDKEKPKKVNDHAMDELRYYIMSKPDPFVAGANEAKFKSGGSYYRSELIMKGLTDYEIDRYARLGQIHLIGN